MITIIRGTPGSGKTALLVEMMLDELRNGRKIYTFGIPKLVLPVQEAGDVKEWQAGTWLQIDRYDPLKTKQKGIKSTWFPRGCPDTCEFLSTCPRVGALNPATTPDSGALLIIDEAHTEFPQRPSGKAPPDYIEALTVHRHQGIDIWFVSQRPAFLDPFVRGLSSRHIHLSLNAFSFTGARSKFEWTEYQETVNRMSKMLASKSSYKPSPAVFPLYASASIHTKLDQRMPTILKVFLVMLALVGFMAFVAVGRVKSHMQAIDSAQVSSTPAPIKKSPVIPVSEPPTEGARGTSGAAVGGGLYEPPKPAQLQISSCISNASRCHCYTDKGVKIPMQDGECRASVAAVNERFKLDDAPRTFNTITNL